MIDGKPVFDLTDLREELTAIWGDMPYVITSSTPNELKKTTLVEARCRNCQDSKKVQINTLLNMKETHGCSCTVCKTVGLQGDAEESVELPETPASEETAAEPDGAEGVQDPRYVLEQWQQKIDERLVTLVDELKYIPLDSVEIIRGDEKTATVKYVCSNCGSEHTIQIKSPSDLKAAKYKDQNYFACETCVADVKKYKELNSLKKRVVAKARSYGFESASFAGPVIERTTEVTVGIGDKTWKFQVQDIMEPHDSPLLIGEDGKFFDEEQGGTLTEQTFSEEATTQVAQDPAPESEESELIEEEVVPVEEHKDTFEVQVSPAIVIDDEDGPELLGDTPVTEAIVIADDSEYEDEAALAESAQEIQTRDEEYEQEIVGDLDGIPVTRGIEITDDEDFDSEIIDLDRPVRHGGQETISTTSGAFAAGTTEFQANRVFRDEDVLASSRYSDRLEQSDKFIKFLDKIRDFTGVGYQRLHHERFMDVPVALIKVPGAPFAVIYVDNRERSYQSYVIDQNAITQVFMPVTKCACIVIYSDQIEQRAGQLAASMAKMVDRIRKDSRALPDDQKINLMETNRYYLAWLEDKSVTNEFCERYNPFATNGRSNRTLAVVGIDRRKTNDGKKLQENMVRIQRAMMSGRNIDTSAFNWRIPCAIRYLEEVKNNVTVYTITQYIENFNLFLEDGLEVAVAMLIRRHFAVKGNVPLQIQYEYHPYDINPPAVNRLLGDKKRQFSAFTAFTRNMYYVNTNKEYIRTEQAYFNPRSLVAMFGSKLDRVNLGDNARVVEFMKSEGFLLYPAPAIYTVTVNIQPYLLSLYGMVSKDPRSQIISRIVGRVEQPSIRGNTLDFDKETQRTLQFIAGQEYMTAMREYAAKAKEAELLKQATEGEGVEAPQAATKQPQAPQMTPQQMYMMQYNQMMYMNQMRAMMNQDQPR